MSGLWPKAPIPASRDFSGKSLPSSCFAAGPRREVIRGPDEAGDSSRGAGAKECNGRTEGDDRPVRIDTGDRGVNHCGGEAGKGSGHQQTIAKTDIGDC